VFLLHHVGYFEANMILKFDIKKGFETIFFLNSISDLKTD